MPDELRLLLAFGLALLATLALVPIAIRAAALTGLVDTPGGYKGHRRPTPYLGGAAVALAVAAAVVAAGAATSRFAPILIWAVALAAVGTVDDKRSLNPGIRLAIEALAGAALWHYGLGWGVLPGDAANLALTIFWVIAVVNAFNLMDNMDGAAPTVGAISAVGTAALAIVAGQMELAVILLAVAGACVGFLRFNLARPARIFLGDGGSMPLGFVLAASVMAAQMDLQPGLIGLLAAIPLVGLPILDTTLVVISRRRGRRAVLSGGRDHLTHRLMGLLGSAISVSASLATVQSVLCVAAVLLAHSGATTVAIFATIYIAAALAAIYTLETRWQVTAGVAQPTPFAIRLYGRRLSVAREDSV